jgi:hypothetical protein
MLKYFKAFSGKMFGKSLDESQDFFFKKVSTFLKISFFFCFVYLNDFGVFECLKYNEK